jgi:adenylosuccinate lyase
MIPRYTHPDMGRIWSEERRFETWLQVEIAAAEAMAEAGIIPQDAARDIRELAKIDVARIAAIEETTQHDVIAFTTAVAEHVGPSARWLHFGLTSSDVVDTAQALQMREGCDLLLKNLDGLLDAVRARAQEHRRTPMIGRTHGVHAEPMTFGLKLALWYAELQRDHMRLERARAVVSVGKISGAVGTFAHLDPSIEASVCRTLGLEPAPVSSQVIQRDRHAELMATIAITGASLEKFALEVRGLQKTEIGEVEEPFGRGQKGSSAMPHKRNPIGCEQITGLSRLLRANSHAALENVALWHERDISHSSVERVILPDSFIALDHMLRRFTRIVKGLAVHPDRMRENLDRSRGVAFSGTVLLELAQRGVPREQAYEWVQRNAMRSHDEKKDFKQLLLADADVMNVLDPKTLQDAFDLTVQLKNVDAIFDRVFSAPVAAGAGRRTQDAGRRTKDPGPLMRARVFVTLKPSVFDPQGKTIVEALRSLGYGAIEDVRQGKYFELELAADSRETARMMASEVADKLLANPVIEAYRIEVD